MNGTKLLKPTLFILFGLIAFLLSLWFFALSSSVQFTLPVRETELRIVTNPQGYELRGFNWQYDFAKNEGNITFSAIMQQSPFQRIGLSISKWLNVTGVYLRDSYYYPDKNYSEGNDYFLEYSHNRTGASENGLDVDQFITFRNGTVFTFFVKSINKTYPNGIFRIHSDASIQPMAQSTLIAFGLGDNECKPDCFTNYPKRLIYSREGDTLKIRLNSDVVPTNLAGYEEFVLNTFSKSDEHKRSKDERIAISLLVASITLLVNGVVFFVETLISKKEI